MVFGTFRIYGYRLCFAVRGFRKRYSKARFRDSFAACFAVRGFRACVLLFEAFGSAVPRPDFARPKRLFAWDLKGNVKAFFDSGFGRFSARVPRWCLGLFASRAPRPERVLLFEAFGLVFFCSRAGFRDSFASVFCCFEAFGLVFCCSRLSEAVFQGQISRGPKDCFLWILKVTWNSFLARVLAVFGSCLDGV